MGTQCLLKTRRVWLQKNSGEIPDIFLQSLGHHVSQKINPTQRANQSLE